MAFLFNIGKRDKNCEIVKLEFVAQFFNNDEYFLLLAL